MTVITRGIKMAHMMHDLGRYPLCLFLVAVAMSVAWSRQISAAPFTNMTTVVLQQGIVPMSNGVPIGGVPAYSGCVDTYTDSANPDTSYSAATSLYFAGTAARRLFIRFDLYPYVPSNSVIVSAQLVFTSEGEPEWVAANAGVIQALDSAWSPTMTWNSDPGVSGPTVGFYMHSSWNWAVWPAGTLVTQDLTHVMQAWVTAQHPNHGFRIVGPGGSCTMRRVASADHATEIYRPRLTVQFLVPERRVYTLHGVFRNDVYALNAATNIEDTCVDMSHTNSSTNPILGTIKTTYNGSDFTAPRRALFRVINTNEPLSKLLASTNAIVEGKPRLIAAQLNLAIQELSDSLQFWDCSQNWSATVVTDQTRDGIHPWAEAWTNTAISNVGNYYGMFVNSHHYLGSTFVWDITPAVQRYADGGTNTGFVLGQTSGAEYWTRLYSMEYSIPWLRPTLILQTWTKLQDGTVMCLR